MSARTRASPCAQCLGIRVKYIQPTMDFETYRVLFESIPEGIVLLDKDGVITHLNGNAAHLLGQEVQELVGTPLHAILPSLDEKTDPANPSFASDQAETFCTLSSRGQEVVLAVSSVPLGGVPPHARGLILRDVTVSHATYQMQAYFLANITHEFRTPLSALKASVELILDSLGEVSHSELERLLRSIHYSVAGLQTLIDNLLESASIESGHFRISPQEARLHEIIGEAAHVMAPLLQRREQGLQIEMDWSLPPLHLDSTRITQVLVNLLSNASKYGPTGTGIRIRVQRLDSNRLLVSVIDQGAGLSLHDREKLFKRFVRLSDQTGSQFGVGLGLSVVKTIVEAHGGTVGVDENPEGGSIFWFTLPMQANRETPP